jgi:hypothetical protein
MEDLWTIKKHSKCILESKKIGKFNFTDMEFAGHNVLGVSLLENGSDYGNSGHGPIVKIKFSDGACTQMYLNGKEVDEFVIEFRGMSERDQLVTALVLIVKELKKS